MTPEIAARTSSFKITQLDPNDILFMPAGYVYAEFGVNADALGLRIASTIFTPDCVNNLKWLKVHLVQRPP